MEYLPAVNCDPADPQSDPPNPLPKDPAAIDPKVMTLSTLPKVGALLDIPLNVDLIDEAASMLAVDPKAGGNPEDAATLKPVAGFVGLLVLFCC